LICNLAKDFKKKKMSKQTLVIDNGGDTIKIGYAATSAKEVQEQAQQDVSAKPYIIPNVIAKHKTKSSGSAGSVFIGDQLEIDCQTFASLLYKRPIERGYLVDCETQAVIWDHIFSNYFSEMVFDETRIFLPHQPFTPKTIQKDICQLLFEYFGFKEYASFSSQFLSFYGYLNEVESSDNKIKQSKSALVIDSGFSFSHIYPIVNSIPEKRAIQRIDVGGKVLTNYLKEQISGRYYDMMEETYLMNLVKERLCYVSTNYLQDLKSAEYADSPLFRDYVLPDYKHSKTGYLLENTENVDEELQVLRLNNERIAIPELLFTPSDLGINQAGIAEASARTVLTNIKSPVSQGILLDTILLTGGNTKFKNFAQRVRDDVRQMAPQDYKSVNVVESRNPITLSWRGASAFSFYEKQSLMDKYTVKKEEYEEVGFEICQDKFHFS